MYIFYSWSNIYKLQSIEYRRVSIGFANNSGIYSNKSGITVKNLYEEATIPAT